VTEIKGGGDIDIGWLEAGVISLLVCEGRGFNPSLSGPVKFCRKAGID